MANCYSSDNYTEDNKVELNLLLEKKYGLKDLTFSKYEQKQLHSVTNILDFDREKLEIKAVGENSVGLYENNHLLLEIKAFCRLIIRGKDLVRKKKVKIINQLVSFKIWEVFAEIHSKIYRKRYYLNFL